MILDRSSYDEKIQSLLADGTYSRLTRDPTKKLEKQVQQHLKPLVNSGELDQQTYMRLNHTHAHPLYLYGLLKIYKPDVPLGPIISTMGSPTYALSKFLAKVISPLSGNLFVKNSAHFVELINQ